MTSRRFVVLFARGAAVALAVALSSGGCSRQGEGERCDRAAAGDTDCDTGLRCVSCNDLERGSVDRCCPPNPGSETSPACQRSASQGTVRAECVTATGGTTGSGGGAGAAGGGMSGSGGASGGSGGTSAGTTGEAGASDAAGAGGQ